jgi:imidazolonepropionase-like amidohydrolase
VKTIEHGTLIAEATLRLMAERGSCLVPTISFWADMLEPGGEYDDSLLKARAATMLPRVRAATALAARMGVKVAAGSDMRYETESNRRVSDEAASLAGSGLTPMAAIQAATSVAADCLGVQKRTGSIAVGKEADLIVVDGDPLSDIRRLRNVLLVINDGRVSLDRLTK